ncbi:hypothetical protein DWX97_00080 [Bacteroides cellulosilyticus]|uniref:Uncharacterized protein n=2 Tax=Bacteroides TaxID=816 RepID=A0A412ING7_9BACE|nr:hypothetical protein HMPREF2531_04279 [Bacteroides intestinalis]RGQ09943.1 hypothetical protein DWZ09_21580 [Bacteroides cellulosilyticus]RGS39730.1 hypothetical protein DWX97_00080 [Bacteroides cellulosilyticus]
MIHSILVSGNETIECSQTYQRIAETYHFLVRYYNLACEDTKRSMNIGNYILYSYKIKLSNKFQIKIKFAPLPIEIFLKT